MAVIQVNFISKSFYRTVPVTVILPIDKIYFPGMPVREDKPFKTLYLLHGVQGNHMDWMSNTCIQRYAEEKNLAVVMPAGENAFYLDQPWDGNYHGTYIGEELVEMTRKMFPLSHKREDTFIGGLSMGGYGAIRNGLKYSDTFGAIVSLSAALVVEDLPHRTNDTPIFLMSRDYATHCFGDLDTVLESDRNPKYLIDTMLKEGKKIPDIYMACGTEDVLRKENEDFVHYLQERNIPVTYEKGPGNHEWSFWERYIQRAINWLPTEDKEVSINSGNIGIDKIDN